MRYVDCGPQPPFLDEIVKNSPRDSDGNVDWQYVTKQFRGEYRQLVDWLANKYGYLCAYCESYKYRDTRDSDNDQWSKQISDDESEETKDFPDSLEHFRPRSKFPDRVAEWENLNYACLQCDVSKRNFFPGRVSVDREALEKLLKVYNRQQEHRYVDPSEDVGYVNPRDSNNRAEKFFTYDKRGRIFPNPNLNDVSWSKAVRTILDFGLFFGTVDIPCIERRVKARTRTKLNLREKRRDAYRRIRYLRSCPINIRDASIKSELELHSFPSFIEWMEKSADPSAPFNP